MYLINKAELSRSIGKLSINLKEEMGLGAMNEDSKPMLFKAISDNTIELKSETDSIKVERITFTKSKKEFN